MFFKRYKLVFEKLKINVLKHNNISKNSNFKIFKILVSSKLKIKFSKIYLCLSKHRLVIF